MLVQNELSKIHVNCGATQSEKTKSIMIKILRYSICNFEVLDDDSSLPYMEMTSFLFLDSGVMSEHSRRLI